MRYDFRHYCLISLFSNDDINTCELVENNLSDNQAIRAEQLLKNTRENIDIIIKILQENSHNWNVDRIGKTEKTSLILGISELILNLTPFKVIISEWTKLTDKHGSSDGAKFVNAILDNISKNNDSI
ncbi:MAG: transcription antitermination factor NusB [Candidatus Actinomarina sp.]|jgi:N utilization substance protein B|tara:strand:+ start:3509 stop:3889 length:381 start_codon:yes stop_codon:yes gene_type:complete